MPQGHGRRQQVPTGRSERAVTKPTCCLSLKCILRAVLWMCEGTLGGKRVRHGRDPEAAEVAGLRQPGGVGGETGPQHPRPPQITMHACENTRPELSNVAGGIG